MDCVQNTLHFSKEDDKDKEYRYKTEGIDIDQDMYSPTMNKPSTIDTNL